MWHAKLYAGAFLSVLGLSKRSVFNFCTAMPMRWQDRIVSTPDVLKGKPRLKNTRIPVSLILGYLAEGASTDDILQEFPDLEKEDVAACLSYARDLSEFEVAA